MKKTLTKEQLARIEWETSSLSQGENTQCVEVGLIPDSDGDVAVRDSKDPHGSVLRFTREEWSAFRGGVARGEFHYS